MVYGLELRVQGLAPARGGTRTVLGWAGRAHAARPPTAQV